MEKEERPSGSLKPFATYGGIEVDCGYKLIGVIFKYVGVEVFDGEIWRCCVRILKCHKGVVCETLILIFVIFFLEGGDGGSVWRGFLTLNLTSLSVVLLPNNCKCVHIFWSMNGDVCCDSHRVMACINSLLG